MSNKYQDLYNRLWSGAWATASEIRGPSSRHRNRLILSYISKLDLRGRILDIGCGDGYLLNELSKRSEEIYGLDISEEAIELAKSRFNNSVHYLIGDTQKSETLPKLKFDLIICSEVLEHVKDDERSITNMCNLLIEGGKLIVTTPHRQEYWSEHDTAAGHLRRYEIDDLAKKLMRNGMKLLKVTTWGFPFYHLYFKFILNHAKPSTTFKQKNLVVRIVLDFLYILFYVDDLFKRNRRGRMLFLIAEKYRNHRDKPL